MNAPAPYMGQEKYIFISYSHRDTAQVYPIISELITRGYRVWYDSGIDPGTEWDENIAQHINECGYFIAFMSGNYLGSNNCKDELNYARDLEKERLIVYLEEVTLPSGMAMRVNRLQSIFKYAYPTEAAFYEKLCTAKNIDVCYAPSAQPTATVAAAATPAVTAPATPSPPVTPAQPQYRAAPPNSQTPPAKPTASPPNYSTSPNYRTPPAKPKASPPNYAAPPTYQALAASTGYAMNTGLPVRNKTLAGVLAILFGSYGIQKFYLGKIGAGVLCILFCWTLIPGIVGIVEGINILTSSDEAFQRKYRCRIG